MSGRCVSVKTASIWLLTLALPLMVLWMPITEVFTGELRTFLALTLLCILLFAFENIPQTVVAIFLPLGYVLMEVAPSAVVFSPWSQNVPWMMLGGLMLAQVLERVGLLNRVAYKCIILTGGTYRGILWGLALTGIVLNLMIPGSAVIPLAALSYGICTALGLGRSSEAAGIMLTAAMAALLPLLFLFNPNIFMILNGGAAATGALTMGWGEYLLNNAVGVVFYGLMVYVATLMFKPTQTISGKAYFVDEYKKMGAMTVGEKKAGLVCLLLFLFLISGNGLIHDIEVAWGFAIIPLLFFVPGIGAGDPADLKRINYGFILFITACMGIGAVAGHLGLGQMIADGAMPMLAGKSPTFVLMFVWLLCVLLNFILTPLAIMAAFSLPLAQIALNLGLNPKAVYFVLLHGCDQVLLPYEYALYLIFFSFGLIRLGDFVKLMSVKLVLNGLFVLLLLIPFWRLVGYLYL